MLGASERPKVEASLLTQSRRVRTRAATAVVALLVLGTGPASTRLTDASTGVIPIGLAVSPGLAVQPSDDTALPVVAAAPPVAVETELALPPAPPALEEAVIAPPPAVFDAPSAPPPPPPPLLEAPPPPPRSGQRGGTWAVIVGINDYPGSRSDLRSAVNDANDVDRALAGLGVPAENRLVLRDGQATADAVRRSVDWLVSRAGPGATGVFAFAGHVRKVDGTTEALVGADGAVIEDRELGERLAALQAARAWIAIAGCYGGGFTEVLAPGRVLTGAAAADSLAYETSEFNRSYMVQYMVVEAMIEKRAPASVQAAFAYATAELGREHPHRRPVQFDAGSGPLDLRPGASPAPAPAGTPATGAPPRPPSTPPTTTCRQLLLFSCR